MKNPFFRYFSAIVPFVALCSCAFAQNSKLGSPLNFPTTKELAYADEPKAEATSINAKALKNFTKSYQKQSDASWFALDDGFVAIFEADGVKTKAYYDSKGRPVGDVRTYQEDKLPREIRHMVKSTYYDFNIFLVNEVTVGNAKAYLIKIEDKTSFKTIRVQDGEMSETEAFIKSK